MSWQPEETATKVDMQKELFVDLSAEESALLKAVREDSGITIDQLSLQCDLPVSKVSAFLLNLEFHGLVKCLPGKIYKTV
jgi:DNA processing protein